MRLLCLGDVAPTRVDQCDQIWVPPADMTPGDEFRILFNWELPIGGEINPISRVKGPRLLAHPDSHRLIHTWSPGYAALATNHMLDGGEASMNQTINALSQSGFITIGAGRNQDEISKHAIWETEEGRLAILNWVFPETHPDWAAIPGPNCWPGYDSARDIVAELKKESDWILATVHWSDEIFPYPRLEDRITARELVRMGIDVLIGHHPHVVRGMEHIDGCPVFYSIGNFYFSNFADRNGNWIVRQAPRNREGLGVMLDFKRGKKPAYRTIPFWNTHKRAVIDRFQRATRHMTRFSSVLEEHQGSSYEEWYKKQRKRFFRWEIRWRFSLWQHGWRGLIRYAMRYLKLRPVAGNQSSRK